MPENADKLTPEQKERKIEKLPTLFQLFSYSCFPGACIVGPFFEYTDYINFIEQNGRYSKIPYSSIRSFEKMGSGLLFMTLSILVPIFYDANYCGTHEFAQQSFLYKNFFYYIAMAGARYKYYSAWYLSDGAIIMSGLGFNGKNDKGENQWDRIVSVYGYEIEYGTNPRTLIDYWNHPVADWLRFYVFIRFKNIFPKAGFFATLFTMMVSAFWHGFYPVYYFFFFYAALLAEATKDLYRSRFLFHWIPSVPGSVICHILTLQSLNFMGISFVLLTIEKAFVFYRSLYFYPPLGCALIIIIFRLTPIGKIARKKSDKALVLEVAKEGHDHKAPNKPKKD